MALISLMHTTLFGMLDSSFRIIWLVLEPVLLLLCSCYLFSCKIFAIFGSRVICLARSLVLATDTNPPLDTICAHMFEFYDLIDISFVPCRIVVSKPKFLAKQKKQPNCGAKFVFLPIMANEPCCEFVKQTKNPCR